MHIHMKKILIFSALLMLGGLAAKAQTMDANPAAAAGQDTAHRHAMHRNWAQGRPGQDGQQKWGNKPGEGGDHRFAQRGFQRGRGFHREGFGGFARVRYTPDQRKQLVAINSEFKRKQEDLYKQDNLTLGAYKAQLLALQKDRKSKTEGLLTADQKQEVAKGKQRASDNEQVMAAARLERLKLSLQLSDDQEAKIKSQETSFREQLLSIRNNEDLLPDQKRDQMKALFSKQKDAITAVLTPDQQTKLKSMRSDMHRPGRQDGGDHQGGWGGGR
jgi:hypothetical protein